MRVVIKSAYLGRKKVCVSKQFHLWLIISLVPLDFDGLPSMHTHTHTVIDFLHTVHAMHTWHTCPWKTWCTIVLKSSPASLREPHPTFTDTDTDWQSCMKRMMKRCTDMQRKQQLLLGGSEPTEDDGWRRHREEVQVYDLAGMQVCTGHHRHPSFWQADKLGALQFFLDLSVNQGRIWGSFITIFSWGGPKM